MVLPALKRASKEISFVSSDVPLISFLWASKLLTLCTIKERRNRTLTQEQA